jgi:hypothetical protein
LEGGEAVKTSVLSVILSRPGSFRKAIAFAALVVFAFALYTAVGVFQTEFGAYGDEGMHYVTGLMVRDFVLTPASWSRPMPFAKEYYLHFPKVGLGNWPPGFAILQTLWSLPFGDSRHSMLTFMTVMAVVLAYLVFRIAEPGYGGLLALLGSAILLAAPLTQSHAAMVMAEIPLAIVSFLAMLMFARFLVSESWRDTIYFGILTSAAILIKGNAWNLVLMTGFALLFSGRLRVLAGIRFWVAAAIIGVMCVPYTLLTMHIVQQGWNTASRHLPPAGYIHSLVLHLRLVAEIYGYPLTVVALAGVISVWRTREALWRTAVAYAVAVILFHALVPTSAEARKLFQIVPVLALFVVAGLNATAQYIPQRFYPRPAVCTAGALVFLIWGFVPLDPFRPGFGPLVDRLLILPSSRSTATLISSSAYLQDCEAGIIAEWMERDHNRETYLVRGTKLLARVTDDPPVGLVYRTVSENPVEISGILQSVPIAAVILHTTDTPRSYPHHEILRRALEGHPEDWERIYEDRRMVAGLHHEMLIYRQRRDVQGIPVRLSVDLTRKIGDSLETPRVVP